jgi:hypothetical protein
MDSKKSAARAVKDVRVSTNGSRSPERSQILTKRPSAPPPDLVAKKRERSSLPPPVIADNDNNAARVEARAASAREPSKAPPTPMSAIGANVGRTRLPTGSLHTEARTPAAAETIKQRLTALVNTQQKLVELKRSSQKHFYEIGELLHRVREQRLYEVKGYSSFESFIEREVNLGQQFCLQSVRIFETFLPAAVTTYGFHRLAGALAALDQQAAASQGAAEVARMARSPIPPHKL